MTRLVLGTRGSDLARAQTALVEEALHGKFPDLEVAVEIITTRGDEKSGASFQLAQPAGSQVTNLRHGRKGAFTAEIERALLGGKIDVAVHSAKDLPSDSSADLEICAALPRVAAEDVLITKSAVADFRSLPDGATIATGSVRRQHQVRWLRSDVNLVDLRGNVPTRLRKLIASSWDGIILARAGLERLGFECGAGEIDFESHTLRTLILPNEQFVPAGGQGIVALQTRRNDEATRALVALLNHSETLMCLRAEREFLRLLHGDCGTPVGVHARLQNSAMIIHAQLFVSERAEPRVETLRRDGAPDNPEAIGAELLELINGGKKEDW